MGASGMAFAPVYGRDIIFMPTRHSGTRGFTTIEVAIVLALAAIVMSVTMPQLARMARHARLRSAVREMYSLVLATRMQAIKRNSQVVMFVDVNTRRIVTWADRIPYNYVQDANEPTINSYSIPAYVYIPSVAFDGYGGDKKIKDLIAFGGDGTLVEPQKKGSKPPDRPSSYTTKVPPGSVDCKKNCRGIYVSDKATGDEEDQNIFRISVDDFGPSGRASLLKRLPAGQGGNSGETNYVPPPWTWVN
jgi:type II secretory pathway pseudopilin PulG